MSSSIMDAGSLRIQREIIPVRSIYHSLGLSPNDAFLLALAAMSWTMGRCSASLYSWMASQHLPLPLGGTAEGVADVTVLCEAGICGNAEAIFEALMLRQGLQTRKIDIFHVGGSHTFNEVNYANTWHAFDPSWGQYWHRIGGGVDDILSAVDIANFGSDPTKSTRVLANSYLWTKVTQDAHAGQGNGLDWFLIPHYQIKTGATVLYTK